MKFPKKIELKVLKERKRKKIKAKRKKEREKKKKDLAKILKAHAKKKKSYSIPRISRVDGRLTRTKDYSATIYYIIMGFVGLIMLMVFLGIIKI